MIRTPSKYFLLLIPFFFVFALLISPGHAKGDSQDMIRVENITLTRPSDRWRVVQNSEGDLIHLKYLRHGDDITIRVFRRDPIRAKSHITKSQYKFTPKSVKKILFSPYEEAGFKFADITQDRRDISAVGVDSNQGYLLLHFFFVDSDFTDDYVVVETQLKNEDYIPFRDDYEKVVKSLRVE